MYEYNVHDYKNILLDKIYISKQNQKVTTNKKTPLSGGLIFAVFIFFTPILKDQIFIISIIIYLKIFQFFFLSDHLNNHQLKKHFQL